MTYKSIYITAGNEDEAEKIARHLLHKRLITCANMFPIKSLYWWKGTIENDEEIALILKTQQKHVDSIIEEVKRVHSYDVPCIVVWPIEKGNSEYLKWIENETS